MTKMLIETWICILRRIYSSVNKTQTHFSEWWCPGSAVPAFTGLSSKIPSMEGRVGMKILKKTKEEDEIFKTCLKEKQIQSWLSTLWVLDYICSHIQQKRQESLQWKQTKLKTAVIYFRSQNKMWERLSKLRYGQQQYLFQVKICLKLL